MKNIHIKEMPDVGKICDNEITYRDLENHLVSEIIIFRIATHTETDSLKCADDGRIDAFEM